MSIASMLYSCHLLSFIKWPGGLFGRKSYIPNDSSKPNQPWMSVSNITFNFTCKLKQNTSYDTGSNLILQRFLNYRNQGSTPCDDNADHREQPARSRLSRLCRLSRWRWRAGGKRATSLTYPGANCLS